MYFNDRSTLWTIRPKNGYKLVSSGVRIVVVSFLRFADDNTVLLTSGKKNLQRPLDEITRSFSSTSLANQFERNQDIDVSKIQSNP